MAWNVVIAGGGFGGAAAARELERMLPKQSARLVMANETNFTLYTPFLPEAAAGTLEPRHVMTPLRDILKRTYLRIGSIVGHDPEAKTVALRANTARSRRCPTISCCSRWARSRGCCRCRGWPSTRSASSRSPTRSTCATTWSRRWRKPTRPTTRRGAKNCSPTSSSAAATPASRRSPSCRTSPPTRWTATRAPACTGCAGSWSRQPTGSCRRSTSSSPSTRCASCAAAASTSASRRRWRRSAPTSPASPAARRCRPGPSSGPPASPRSRS